MKMPFFRKKQEITPRTRKTKRPSLDIVLERALVKKAKADPEWAMRMATQRYNLKDDVDPIEEAKKKAIAHAIETDEEYRNQVQQQYLEENSPQQSLSESLDDQITQASLQVLQDNPELLKDVATKKIQRAIGGGKSTGSPMSDLRSELQAFREMEEDFGEKHNGGGLGGLIDADVVKALINQLPSLMGRGQVALPSPIKYIVETSQGLMEMSPEAYRQYLEQRGRALPAKTTSPSQPSEHPLPAEPSLSIEVPVLQTEPSIIDEWAQYLYMEPPDVITALESRADNQGKFVLNLVRTKTADQILALVQPFKDKYSKEIEQLTERKEWLEEVCSLAKESIE